MTETTPKPAWQSLGILAPLVALISYFLQQRYGITIPLEIAGYTVDILTGVIPLFIALGIWGRKKARAVISRWV